MSAELSRPSDYEATTIAPPDGLFFSATETAALILGSLPTGARLVLRCRKDWRFASVAAREPELERIVLTVASPSGHTYRIRRPADSPLTLEGSVPLLGEGSWRASLARYDARW